MYEEENTPETNLVTVETKGPSPDSLEVRDIIRKRVYLVMGIGVIPLPFFNVFTDALVQMKLVSDLCKVYNVEYKESLAKNLVSSVVGGATTLAIKPFLEKAALGVPLVGLPLAVATQPVLNGMTTYAIGRMFAQHFHTGGGLVTSGVKELTDSFCSAFRESRQWIGNVIAGKSAEAETVATS
ncbi:MAG: YcjF family protein [Planctomycetes bacterium]|nr:YcjF family protein [Planctomycetota bacterium]MCD7895113.1 YcjF family protein [Planctomycetaceae bacterium]